MKKELEKEDRYYKDISFGDGRQEEGLILVLGLCLTCFGPGYAIGSKDNNKIQK